MALLNQINQMKQQGYSESQIIDSLKKQGHSPKEIQESLAQSKIKSEVSQKPMTKRIDENMQPSIMSESPQYPNEYSQENSQTQNQYTQSNNQYPNQTNQDYQQTPQYPEYQQPQQYQEYPQPQQYPEYQGYENYPEYSYESSTMNEIAEQVTEEKISKIKKEINSLTKFKQETSIEIDSILKRLEKIENTLDELQISIIRKVGEYGENIKNISKEMKATQDSFSKIISPLTENMKELRKISNPQQKTKSKSKKSDSFENYLR